MAQAKIQTNLEKKLAQIFDAKAKNYATNVETHTRYLKENEDQIAKLVLENNNLHETIKINQNLLNCLQREKIELAAGIEQIHNTGKGKMLCEIYLEVYGDGYNPDPDPVTADTEQTLDEMVQEAKAETEPAKQPEPQPERIAATLPGETASEQIANVPPIEKKPEATEPQASEPSPVAVADNKKWLDVDGYSFLADTKNRTFEFYPSDSEERFEGVWNAEIPAIIGLRTGDRKLMTYSIHAEEWLAKWDGHLFKIEKALQQILENPEFKVKFPPRANPKLETALKTPYRADGLISLPCNNPEFKATQKIDGYTVSYKEHKPFTLSGKPYTSITLKVLGEGTTAAGQEVNCSFGVNENQYIISVKNPDGKNQVNDKTKGKREAMPKHLQPLRRAAIQWMQQNFPYTAPKWEDQVTYVTPAPKPTDKTPGNAAADNSDSEK